MGTKKRSPIVLVDGDPLVYRTGFVHQKTQLSCVAEWPDSKVADVRFGSKTERNEWLKSEPEAVLISETREIVADPVEFALQGVKHSLAIIGEKTNSQDLRIYLSGSRNFRLGIATIAPYKGNRDPSNRPIHYAAIREYMTGTHLARVIEGWEADDEISIQARIHESRGDSYIVASIDKDLDQITGEHYDYGKHVAYSVHAEDADDWFWQQVLSGDPGDNVPGCFRIGPDRAAGIVADARVAGMDDAAIWRHVIIQYGLSQSKKGCPYADKDPAAVALETAQLVYMQQKRCELWQPPGVPRGTIEGCEVNEF